MGDELGQAWRDHRRHVLDIAFRMLGNLGEAEDVVVEAARRVEITDEERDVTELADREPGECVHRDE